MDLLQLVPILPPALSGVGDYATLLAGELQASQDVQTRFLVGTPSWTAKDAVSFPTRVLPERTAPALERALAEDGANTLLLHYVGYGYAPRGCPFWLVDAIERWKHAQPSRRLIVLFHELYATGPIWSSSFWNSPFQKWLATRLGRAADVRRMTTEYAAGQLRKMLGSGYERDATIECTPVFSTLGEPATVPPLSARRRQIVVFGSRSWRAGVYTHGMADLTDVCRRLDIERVVDVGAPLDNLPGGSLPVPLEVAGPLSATEASALFSESLAGYFTYPVPYLAKSTIFAAYCAHGLLPLTVSSNDQPNPDGLTAGTHFFAGAATVPMDADALAQVATAARGWYDGHRLAAHAAGVRRQISGTDVNQART